MALSANTVWEINASTGNDSNGGGFVTGASGTDKTQGTGLSVTTRTDLAVDATTNTLVSSTASPFAASDVGNLIQITAGTGWTTGFYQITAFNSGTSQVTLDSSPAATSTTGGTGTVGGALATISKIIKPSSSPLLAGHTVYANAAANFTELVDFGSLVGTETAPMSLIGYTTTRSDNGKITISASGSRTYCLQFSGNQYWIIKNVQCQDATTLCINALTNTLKYNRFENCRLTKGTAGAATCTACGSSNFASSSNNLFIGCEIDSFTQANIWRYVGGTFRRCVFRNNAPGAGLPILLLGLSNQVVERCMFVNNTGTALSMTVSGGGASLIANNTFYNNSGGTSDAIAFNTGNPGCYIANNIFVNNGRYGINCSQTESDTIIDYNAYYNNGTAAINGTSAGTHDITLTASPFTNTANNDYSLNSAAGGGAACKAAAANSFPFSTGTGTTAFLDLGAAQSQGGGGGGSSSGVSKNRIIGGI